MTTQKIKFGQLAQRGGHELPVTVCKSQAGYYLGTKDGDGLPFSRESVEYWRRPEAATKALTSGQWTQKPEP